MLKLPRLLAATVVGMICVIAASFAADSADKAVSLMPKIYAVIDSVSVGFRTYAP